MKRMYSIWRWLLNRTYVFSMRRKSVWNVRIQYERNVCIQYGIYFWRERRKVIFSMTSSFEQKTRIHYDLLSERIYSVRWVVLDGTYVFSMTRRSGRYAWAYLVCHVGWDGMWTSEWYVVLNGTCIFFSMTRTFVWNVCIPYYVWTYVVFSIWRRSGGAVHIELTMKISA